MVSHMHQPCSPVWTKASHVRFVVYPGNQRLVRVRRPEMAGLGMSSTHQYQIHLLTSPSLSESSLQASVSDRCNSSPQPTFPKLLQPESVVCS